MVFRELYAARFLTGSVAFHLVLGATAWRLQPPEHPVKPVTIEIVQAERRPPAPVAPATPEPKASEAVKPPPVRPVASPRPDRPDAPVPGRPTVSKKPDDVPPGTAADSPPTSGQPSGGGASSDTPGPPPPPGQVNLFPSSVLGVVAGAGPTLGIGPRGRTRRAGDGHGDPNAVDAGYGREEAAAKVRQDLAEIVGKENARSGNVAPVWRDAERHIEASFKPAPEVVTSDNRALGWLKTWSKSKPEGGQTPRALDPSREVASQRYDQLLAGSQPSSSSITWNKTIIEAVVDKSGQFITPPKVVSTSGRSKLDELALEAVHKAMTEHPVQDPRGRVKVRWSIEAAVVTSGLTNFGFTFDETLKKASGNYAFKSNVKTHARLVYVIPDGN